MREGFSVEAARELLASGATDATEASFHVQGWVHEDVLHGYPWCSEGEMNKAVGLLSSPTQLRLDQIGAHTRCSRCGSELSVRFDDPISERTWLALQRARAVRQRVARSSQRAGRERSAISLGNLHAELSEARAEALTCSDELAGCVDAETRRSDEVLEVLQASLRAHEEELLSWVAFELAAARAEVTSWPALSREIALSTEIPALRSQYRSQLMAIVRREVGAGSAGTRPSQLGGTPGARYQVGVQKLLSSAWGPVAGELRARVQDESLCAAEMAALCSVIEAELGRLRSPEMLERSWIATFLRPAEGPQRAVMGLYGRGPVYVIPRVVGEWIQTLSAKHGASACPLPLWVDEAIIETASGLYGPGSEELSSLEACLETARDVLA